MSDATVTIRPGKLIIDGEARDAASGATFETWNPATETRITTVAEAGVEDVDLAVRAARRAFESGPWPRMKAAERARIELAATLKLSTLKEELAATQKLNPLEN